MADKKQVTTSIVILVATVLLILGAVFVSANKGKNSEDETSLATQPTKNTSSNKITTASQYKEGSYSAVGSYQSPGGHEKIKISLTIQKDGTVSSTDASSQAVSGDGAQFQQMFISGYKSKVVGKKIGDIHISQVSGSSLTPEGFNDALQQIEKQARA